MRKAGDDADASASNFTPQAADSILNTDTKRRIDSCRDILADYRLAHAARADLYRRLGRVVEAREAYGRALQLTQLEPERRFIERRLGELA